MRTIYLYEMKRVLCNKLFAAMLLITCAYSYVVLSNTIVLGVAYTAPFSQWSFGAYMGSVAMLLMAAMLFFMAGMYSKKERMTQIVTLATPVNTTAYTLTKCAACVSACVILCLVCAGVGMAYLGVIFGFYRVYDFILPFALVVVPAVVFFAGLGLFAGRIRGGLVYAAMAVCLVFLLPMPQALDLYGTAYFSQYPIGLEAGASGEPDFAVTSAFLLGRILFIVLGLTLGAIGLIRKKPTGK